MKILVVDDHPENRSLIEMYVMALGHEVLSAEDGQAALRYFQEEAPDMVLMDVTLPDKDGYEVTREIRRIAGSRWVPILFVSACNQINDVQRGIDAGGDDYLTKPVDLPLLTVKIRAMQRIAEMQREIELANQRETTHRQAMDMELELARNLIEHLTSNQVEVPGLEIWQLPTSTFNGDLVITARGAGDEIFLLHADSMGHGLSATLPLLLIVQTFRDFARLGYSTAGLVRTMNKQLQQEIPADRYVAATLARIDHSNRLIEIWSGGCPAALLIDANGNVIHRFATANLPLGIQDDSQVEIRTEVIQWQEPCRLVVYSDGLSEAVRPDGNVFGEYRLLAALKGPSGNLDRLKTNLLSHLQSERGHDDISVLIIDCGRNTEATQLKSNRGCEK